MPMLTPRNEAGWLYSHTTVDGQYLTCNIGGIITCEKCNRLGYVVNSAAPSTNTAEHKSISKSKYYAKMVRSK